MGPRNALSRARASDPPRGARLRRVLRRRWGLERLERRIGSPVIDGHRVEVLPDGRSALDGVLSAVAGARRSVVVEMYTWADDRLGRRVAEAVAARAREGLPVHVLVDAFGSFGSEDLIAGLRDAGARTLWYHPLAPWTPRWYPNRRNHRKLVLVDGSAAFIGGVNFTERYSGEFAGEAAWRDLMLRIDGPAVREMARMFLATWARMGGSLDAAHSLVALPPPAGRARVQVVGARGVSGRRSLRRSYVALLAEAQERVFLANAYFAPEAGLRREFVRAARRGVRVDLLLPGQSDVPLVVWAGRASYERLLDAGVRIREMEHAVLHAKVAVFDDRALLAGSANLDHRSFRHNLEIAVNVFDEGTVQATLRAFEGEHERSRPVDPERWRRRRSGRLRERFAYWLRYWL